jgi:hypothetical protein
VPEGIFGASPWKLWAYLKYINAELSMDGIKGALRLRDALEMNVWSNAGSRPAPTVFYSSPLARALETSVLAWGDHAESEGIFPLYSARERVGWEVPDFQSKGEIKWRKELVQNGNVELDADVGLAPEDDSDGHATDEEHSRTDYNEFLDRSHYTHYEKYLLNLTTAASKGEKPMLSDTEFLKYKRIINEAIVEPNEADWPGILDFNKNEDIVTANKAGRVGLFVEDLQKIGNKLDRSAAVIVGHSNFWFMLLKASVRDWKGAGISPELRNLRKEKMANLQTIYAEFSTESCMPDLDWQADMGTKCPDPKCKCSAKKKWCSPTSYKCYREFDKAKYLDCGAGFKASPCMEIVKLEQIFKGYKE